MSEYSENIANLVDCVIRPLVEYEDELQITSREEGRTIIVEVSVNAEDAGKVIGRQGRVIKSVRTLARAAASRNDMHVEVEILD